MATVKALQPVKYSVALRKNPMDENEPKKAYANIQLTGVLNIAQFARHIQDHNTVFSTGTIVGVLTEMSHCLRELLMQGFKVDLGDLGIFYPSISSQGASTLEKFSEQNITKFGANYLMSEALKDMRPEVQFEKVPTRKAVAATLKAQVGGGTSADWSDVEDDDTNP